VSQPNASEVMLRADRRDVRRERVFPIQDAAIRSDGEGRTVEAYCAAFNSPAEINDQDGHYNEVMAPQSFDKTIADNGLNFGVYYNHARTIYGTPDGALSVPIAVPIEPPRPDEHGVLTVSRYLDDNPLADTVLSAIKQRAIKGQSFSGRFVKSVRTRESERSGLPTITRSEVAMREYGPTPFPAYMEARIVATRSAELWMADLLRMDRDERADLFARMVEIATPLTSTVPAGPEREVIAVRAQPGPEVTSSAGDPATPETPAATEPPAATPTAEPATETPATSTTEAGTADEPPIALRSATHTDLLRKIRAGKIQRGM
jgi:HK97 family phage prohead protease